MIKKLLSFFKANSTDKNQGGALMETDWERMVDTEGIDKIIQRSGLKPQFIFKHSTRCPVSSQAYMEVSSVTEEILDDVDINYVDVISERNVSQEIARRFDIEHESPQILLIENNNVVWSASHFDIEAETIVAHAKASAKTLSI